MESAKDGSMELGVDVSVESAEGESIESVKADETLEVLLSKAAYSPWVSSTLVHNADTISADPGCWSCDDGGRPPVDYSSSRVCIINTSKNRLQACQEVLICSLLAWWLSDTTEPKEQQAWYSHTNNCQDPLFSFCVR